jgi:hypothetical protein
MPKAGGSYLELENILDTVEFLLETAIDTHSQHIHFPQDFLKGQCRTRPSASQRRSPVLHCPPSHPPGFRRSQWVARSIVPGRELLVGLILVARAEHTGGTEVGGAGSSQRDWGLHPGADDRSSDEAGRADGARRNAEDRQGRHVGVVLDQVNGRWWRRELDGDGEGRRARRERVVLVPAGFCGWCGVGGLRQEKSV